MNIKQLYEKKVEENLTNAQLAAMLIPKLTHQGLRSHLVKYCKDNGLEMHRVKCGRKPKEPKFKLKGE
jgi:hypothetical protein|tara:strand:+ start:7721 stop:7924 length:204 start_codon:yes stop_codon:yes gene_type:complete